jgi:hypothetical protein
VGSGPSVIVVVVLFPIICSSPSSPSPCHHRHRDRHPHCSLPSSSSLFLVLVVSSSSWLTPSSSATRRCPRPFFHCEQLLAEIGGCCCGMLVLLSFPRYCIVAPHSYLTSSGSRPQLGLLWWLVVLASSCRYNTVTSPRLRSG